MTLADGFEDGIKYKCYLNSPNYVVEVSKGDQILTEEFHWIFEPRFGPDYFDVQKAEEIIDKFIRQLKGNYASN